MNWEGSGFRRCHSGRKGGVWIYGGCLLCWPVTLQSSDLAYKAEGQGQEAGSLFFAALGFCGPTSCTGYTIPWRGAEHGAVVLEPFHSLPEACCAKVLASCRALCTFAQRACGDVWTLTLTEWRWRGTHTLRHFSLIAFTAVLDYYRAPP